MNDRRLRQSGSLQQIARPRIPEPGSRRNVDDLEILAERSDGLCRQRKWLGDVIETGKYRMMISRMDDAVVDINRNDRPGGSNDEFTPVVFVHLRPANQQFTPVTRSTLAHIDPVIGSRSAGATTGEADQKAGQSQ